MTVEMSLDMYSVSNIRKYVQYFLKRFTYYLLFLTMCRLCLHVGMSCRCPWRLGNRCLEVVPTVVSHPMWVLGIKFSALNHWATSPTPFVAFLNTWIPLNYIKYQKKQKSVELCLAYVINTLTHNTFWVR